ncbi:SDR family NAD(P)-dependent oxidoreductase [Patescibacteria group bacterium]|nr:SDR family NAD(P)-dependent oxidoreductase [Patescibacteria group bacterium]
MKKYLITGGAGFIGTNFAEKLLQRNDQVILLDNLSRRGTDTNKDYLINKFGQNVEFVKADITKDIAKLDELVTKVDVVYHLAGQVAVTTSVVDPRSDFEANALGTFNVLEAVRLSQNKPITVFASTNKVYGGMETIEIEEGDRRYGYKHLPKGIPESQLLDFHSPYGCSKGAADQYVRDYSRIYGLRTVVMRQSCIYGTRQFGIEDQGWIAWFTIASVLGRPITIYGNGKQVRDALFVDDLFNAWDTVTQKIDITAGKIYNVGGGSNFSLSLLELVEILEKNLGKKIEFKTGDWRPGDQPVYISDIQKIVSETGWSPKISVEMGVEKLSSWVIENKEMINKVLNF